MIGSRVVFFRGIRAAGEGVAMIWLATVTTPVAKKYSLDHVQSMLFSDVAGQVIQLQGTKSSVRPLLINQSQ